MNELGVFYHIGGVMMDDEYKRRQWENDPPGWYFWLGDNGIRRLHGPYETSYLAQYHESRELAQHRQHRVSANTPELCGINS